MKEVIKRDGRSVPYEPGRIKSAINKACEAVSGVACDDVLLDELLLETEKNTGEISNVEAIQDAVENALMRKGLCAAAKAYILYRDERTRERLKRSMLMEKLKSITFDSRKDSDLKRENANIDGESSMGAMLRYGSEASKQFAELYLLKPEHTKAHESGDIHIHDLDFFGLTETCCQIDLIKLFHGGFCTGHGFIREPASIASYAALACIAIQSNQNDQHGGQSVPNFDYAMAEGIAKSFMRNYSDALAFALECSGACLGVGSASSLCTNIRKRLLLGDLTLTIENYTAYLQKEREHLLSLLVERDTLYGQSQTAAETTAGIGLTEDEIERAQRVAYNHALTKTERDTYQAMEGLIHNLNTMHCLPASERIWVFVNRKLKYLTMEELHNSFNAEPKSLFEVFALNCETGVTEVKRVTASKRMGNQRVLSKVITHSGRSATTTDNHQWKSVNPDGFCDKLPSELDYAVSPAIFSFAAEEQIIDLSEYTSRNRDKFVEQKLRLDEDFAYLLGVYSADGRVSGTGTLIFTTCDETIASRLKNIMCNLYGSELASRDCTYKGKSDDKTVYKETRFNAGEKWCDCFKYLCGAEAKRIPSEVFMSGNAVRKAFLMGYLSCDGNLGANVIKEVSTVSKELRDGVGLLINLLGEYCMFGKQGNLFTVSIGKTAAVKLGLLKSETAFEIPCYDYGFLKDCIPKRYGFDWRTVHGLLHRDKLLTAAVCGAIDACLLNVYPSKVSDVTVTNSRDEYVYDISVEDNENFMTAEGLFVHNSRAGAQVPFSSLNYGTDTTPEGRMAVKNLLLALEAGLGGGETPIFPIHIFKVKSDINYNPQDPNYDLFKLACKVSAKRLFPNFAFIDAPFNLQYYKQGRPETEIAYMGCRTRVIGNTFDPSKEITYGRGNLSFTTINLPRLAIESDKNINTFYVLLLEKLRLCADQLFERYLIQAERKVANYPFLMGQGIWIGSDKLKPNDKVGEILKQGTLSIGFIGLAEALTALTGAHHGESDVLQRLGLDIIKRMRDFADAESAARNMNYSLFATPAEGLSGRFVNIDRARYGNLRGVTDKEYYTNSFHISVGFNISISAKIQLEAPYHALTNAGHITYVEMDGDVSKNLLAFERAVRFMHDCGVGYGAVNHPVDRDPVCGFTGIINDICPKCGRTEGNVPFERIRRITGYLVGTLDRFNDAKAAEVRDRVKHH